MTGYRIGVLAGDGIGPEVMKEAIGILRILESRSETARFAFEEFAVGAGEYLRRGDPMPPATLERIKECDAVLLGAMGLPDVRWPTGQEMTPQLDLREDLELYCGLRPVYLYHEHDTPLKGFHAGQIDLAIVRENTEGMFASRKDAHPVETGEVVDRLRISRRGAERVIRAAFRQARKRRRKVTLVDKSNVLPSMAYFRRIFNEIAPEFPDVEPERIYVDAAALYLVQKPHAFDVLVTENLFGDILSDLAAAIVGGMGMAPSGDIGDQFAVFQPSHGSAPDIAGRNLANPTAMILSAAMMLEWLGEERDAQTIRDAVAAVYADPGMRTRDLGASFSTQRMGREIAAAIERLPARPSDC